MTDPSYCGQIITFTFPHIGNIGTNTEDIEATQPFAHGLVIRENITNPSSFRSSKHLQEWLKNNGLPGICNVDTRAITRHIRLNGPQNAAIYHFGKNKPDIIDIIQQVNDFPSLRGLELAEGVSTKKSYHWDKTTWSLNQEKLSTKNGKYKVVAIDYGIKHNILRCLVSLGCDVKILPAKTNAEEILKIKPDGIFLSNGPGDPAATGEYAIPELKKLINSGIPIFGICLGHQLLSLALGCTTTKMHQGHRGANHPVKDLLTGRVEITSQNHGFTVVKTALPEDVEITHLSLFDDTIEGVRSKTKPVFSVQYHPESSPGPHDSFYLFERFVGMMKG